MKTLAEVKELIKERVDLAARIGKDTKLFKSGVGYKACCPLPGHTEKTPSFNINTRDNYFYCYGCQRGGDIFTYLDLTRGQPFMESLKELAEEFHIEIPKNAERGSSSSQPKDDALELMERTTKYFEASLHAGSTPGAAAAQKYLASRNYTLEDAKKFRLGWAPEDGRRLALKLKEQKLSKMGQELGLLARSRDTEDFFRGRLMIPIEDHRGRVVAFSGRALGLSDNEGPKYKNSPETHIFKKKEVLYGLSRAVKGTRELGWLTIVEGFFDAWAFERIEIPSVAVMGVALTTEHLSKLSKICKQLILVMDTDRAGVESTKRSLPLLYQHGFEVKVFADMGGKDPDEWLAQFKGSRDEVLRVLQRAPEGMEWWATQVIDESRDAGHNALQTVHRLEDLWFYLQSPAHKRFWVKAIGPRIGWSESQLEAHFSQLVAPTAQKSERRLPVVLERDENSLPEDLSADNDEYVLQEIVSLIVNHGAAWTDVHEGKEGTLLKETLEGSSLELPFARAHHSGVFSSKIFLEALKSAGLDHYVARASMNEDSEEPAGRDHRRLMRNLCLQIITVRKSLLIRHLAVELKTSGGDEATAQILQRIQTLRKEVEELKNFSFSV